MLCAWLDCEGGLHTVNELSIKMVDMGYSKDLVYSKNGLKLKFRISIKSLCGKPDLVCFKDLGRNIISDTWYKKRNKNAEKESRRIGNTAAKIIMPEMCSI